MASLETPQHFLQGLWLTESPKLCEEGQGIVELSRQSRNITECCEPLPDPEGRLSWASCHLLSGQAVSTWLEWIWRGGIAARRPPWSCGTRAAHPSKNMGFRTHSLLQSHSLHCYKCLLNTRDRFSYGGHLSILWSKFSESWLCQPNAYWFSVIKTLWKYKGCEIKCWIYNIFFTREELCKAKDRRNKSLPTELSPVLSRLLCVLLLS